MNNYRNEVKWNPFESLFHSSEVLKELDKTQKICAKPILSEDELKVLEDTILRVAHTKEIIYLEYYFQGIIYQKKGIISFIEKNNLKIYFQDHSFLYFEQILRIKIL